MTRSYLYNGNFYTGNMTSLYWIGSQYLHNVSNGYMVVFDISHEISTQFYFTVLIYTWYTFFVNIYVGRWNFDKNLAQQFSCICIWNFLQNGGHFVPANSLVADKTMPLSWKFRGGRRPFFFISARISDGSILSSRRVRSKSGSGNWK